MRARLLGGGGFVTLSTSGDTDAALRAVSVARELGLEAYARGEGPADLLLRHRRFGDAVVLAPPGVAITRKLPLVPRLRGSHGYRADRPAMGALFVAVGAGVKPGTGLGEIRAVDVAPTVLALLGAPVPDWMQGRPIPGVAGPLPAPERPGVAVSVGGVGP